MPNSDEDNDALDALDSDDSEKPFLSKVEKEPFDIKLEKAVIFYAFF